MAVNRFVSELSEWALKIPLVCIDPAECNRFAVGTASTCERNVQTFNRFIPTKKRTISNRQTVHIHRKYTYNG